MADTKLSDLPTLATGSIADADEFYVNDAGVSKKTTAAALSDYTASRLGVFNVVEYGAVGDGVTDDGPAFNLASAAAVTAEGGVILVPPTTSSYHMKTQWIVDSAEQQKIEINAYGAEITTEGSGGYHTGANNASVLTDGTKSFTTNEFVGLTIENYTDGSSGTVTANTATTITATLSGGTDNDWDTDDEYVVGAGSALEMRGGGNRGGISVKGLYVDHRNNLNPTAGIYLRGCGHASLWDCVVVASASTDRYAVPHQNDYGCYRLTQSDRSDIQTGSYHNAFWNCQIRNWGGSDKTKILNGILMEGSVNATKIFGGSYSARNCVRIKQNGVVEYVTNALLVNGADFEGGTYVIVLDSGATGSSPATAVPAGVRVTNCRSEANGPTINITGITQANPAVVTTDGSHQIYDGDTVYITGVVGMTEVNDLEFTAANSTDTTFELQGINSTGYTAYSSGGTAQNGAFIKIEGSDAGASDAPKFANNHIVSSTRTYLENADDRSYWSLDWSETPNFAGVTGHIWGNPLRLHGFGGANHTLDVVCSGGNRGVRVLNGDTTDAALQLVYLSGSGSSTIGKITGRNHGQVHYNSARGISSNNGTLCHNLTGTETFATAATVVVSINTEDDADYHVMVCGDVNETFWVTGRTTTQFTINSSNASSTANVDWFMVRPTSSAS